MDKNKKFFLGGGKLVNALTAISGGIYVFVEL